MGRKQRSSYVRVRQKPYQSNRQSTTEKTKARIKKQISELSDVIRKKYLAPKLGKSENDRALNQMFKPIRDPLMEIVDLTKTQRKNDDIKEEEEKQDIKPFAESNIKKEKNEYDGNKLTDMKINDDKSNWIDRSTVTTLPSSVVGEIDTTKPNHCPRIRFGFPRPRFCCN